MSAMQWKGDNLVIAGVTFASIADYSEGPDRDWTAYIGLKPLPGSNPTREAAMQAAVEAVLKWLREVCGEPVAWAMSLHGQDPRGGYHYEDYADIEGVPNDPAADPNVRRAIPLFALPEVKP